MIIIIINIQNQLANHGVRIHSPCVFKTPPHCVNTSSNWEMCSVRSLRCRKRVDCKWYRHNSCSRCSSCVRTCRQTRALCLSNLATASSRPGCNSTAVQVYSRWIFNDDKSCETLVSEQQDRARTDYRYECQWWYVVYMYFIRLNTLKTPIPYHRRHCEWSFW